MSDAALEQTAERGAAPRDRGPLLVSCRACDHVWPVLWLPQSYELVAKAVPRCCPMCGNTKPGDFLMANEACLERYARWTGVEAARARIMADVAAATLSRVEAFMVRVDLGNPNDP